MTRTIASDATYRAAGNASEGVGSAWLVRRNHSSTVGDASPDDAFPALSSWFAATGVSRRRARADVADLKVGTTTGRAEALRFRRPRSG